MRDRKFIFNQPFIISHCLLTILKRIRSVRKIRWNSKLNVHVMKLISKRRFKMHASWTNETGWSKDFQFRSWLPEQSKDQQNRTLLGKLFNNSGIHDVFKIEWNNKKQKSQDKYITQARQNIIWIIKALIVYCASAVIK